MIYDLNNLLEKEQAIERFKYLLETRKVVDVKVKHPRRSINQNSYLHLILTAFGCEFGYTLEEVKQQIFKGIVNKEIFYKGEKGNNIKVHSWKSTSELDTKELTTAIDRFLNFSAQQGYRLPEPDDYKWIGLLEKEVNNYKEYI